MKQYTVKLTSPQIATLLTILKREIEDVDSEFSESELHESEKQERVEYLNEIRLVLAECE